LKREAEAAQRKLDEAAAELQRQKENAARELQRQADNAAEALRLKEAADALKKAKKKLDPRNW
jgi:F0F1-type ATP synthase membrane subunit b/b'